MSVRCFDPGVMQGKPVESGVVRDVKSGAGTLRKQALSIEDAVIKNLRVRGSVVSETVGSPCWKPLEPVSREMVGDR